ncbi:MAG: hypothetical protein QM736_11965 [Vicinamibacterales bacterium]
MFVRWRRATATGTWMASVVTLTGRERRHTDANGDVASAEVRHMQILVRRRVWFARDSRSTSSRKRAPFQVTL